MLLRFGHYIVLCCMFSLYATLTYTQIYLDEMNKESDQNKRETSTYARHNNLRTIFMHRNTRDRVKSRLTDIGIDRKTQAHARIRFCSFWHSKQRRTVGLAGKAKSPTLVSNECSSLICSPKKISWLRYASTLGMRRAKFKYAHI